MIEVVCLCGKTLKTKDQHAGRTTKCPACQADVTFPGGVVKVVVPQEPAADLPGPFAIDSPQPAVDDVNGMEPLPATTSPPERPSTPRPPLDPWRYTLLTMFGLFVLVLAIGQFGFVVMAWTSSAGLVENGNVPRVNALTVVGSFAIMMAVILALCPLFLVIDIARDIKAIRFNTSHNAG